MALEVPVLDARPFRLRPFQLSDLPLVEEAARDPYIPLITTVPAAYTPGEGRAFIERQWSRAADGTGYSFAADPPAGTARRALEHGVRPDGRTGRVHPGGPDARLAGDRPRAQGPLPVRPPHQRPGSVIPQPRDRDHLQATYDQATYDNGRMDVTAK